MKPFLALRIEEVRMIATRFFAGRRRGRAPRVQLCGSQVRRPQKNYLKSLNSADIGLSLHCLSFGDIITKKLTDMESTMESTRTSQQAAFISPEALLEHWMGHRRLTRRVIEAFPEDKLFTYSAGGMRPFAELAMEMVRMGAPGVRGVVVGKYQTWQEVEKNFKTPATKEELLNEWDRSCEQIKSLWPHIKPERFPQIEKAFDTWEGPIYWSILYYIDNEIHHRGQGYVYCALSGLSLLRSGNDERVVTIYALEFGEQKSFCWRRA